MSSTARPPRTIGVGLVLVATMFTLLIGFAHKSTCLMGDGFDARAYRFECYNDIVPLYRSEGLLQGKFPYLQAPNEYPVGTGLFMWFASLYGRGEGDFFTANAVWLSLLALATAWILYEAVGFKAVYFSLAPTLALYAFLNWDLLAVFLATGATIAFLRRRDAASGVLLGLGIASKLYPVLLLVPFAIERRREGRNHDAIRLVVWAAVAWAIVDVPFMIAAFNRWSAVFRLNSARAVDWGTLWFAGCRTVTGRLACGHTSLVNGLSLALFAGGAVLTWRARFREDPDAPRWTFAFPLVILFLLTTKIYSPQYSLWLLPWFALVMPDLRLFLAFEAADLAVFITEFSWLGRYFNNHGLPVAPLELAVIARAAILLALLIRYSAGVTVPRISGLAWRTEREARVGI